MGGNYIKSDSKKVNLTRYKSDQKDQISIGEGEDSANKDRYSNVVEDSFNSTDYYTNENESIFSVSNKELETSFHKVGDQISKLVTAILPITLFILFFNQLKNGFFENSVQISPGTLSLIAIYFVFFAISVIWLSRKKKIKLTIKNEYLHLSSFPTFHQKFHLDTVRSCYVNAFNHPSNQFDYLTAQIERDSGQYSVNLESGVAIFLNSGKKILIGTSNSLEYYKTAYIQ